MINFGWSKTEIQVNGWEKLHTDSDTNEKSSQPIKTYNINYDILHEYLQTLERSGITKTKTKQMQENKKKE